MDFDFNSNVNFKNLAYGFRVYGGF